jgi:hypothetical protein
MKKPLLIVAIILIVILALPAVKYFHWAFQAKKPLNIIILDKTVPTVKRLNHKSLTWIINNDRFVKKNKRTYSFRKDYYGFFPTRPLREKHWTQNNLKLTEIMDVADSVDALYYADTYGVYFNDWYKGINKSRRSRKLYGGLNNTDYLYLVEMQRRNKLCILEYNTFDYPTAELDRYKTKDRLGIEFNGWTGKYFSSLDTASKVNEDFPIWLTAMYRKKYRQPWTFSKPGVVFLKGSDILVLEEGKELKNAIPYIMTDSANCAKYGVMNKIPFDGWFDVISPLKNKVVSKYKLETTPKGDTVLFENFLSSTFPAVITDNVNQRNYYFCGNFATNKVCYWTSRFFGFSNLKGILYSDKTDDMRRFYWLYYKPLVTNILTDYYNSIGKN